MLSHALRAAAGNQATPTDPNFNQTVLLLHGDGTNGAQNNTFLDSSTNNFTITRNGNTTQGTFTPFSVGASEWSNFFDGSGDYLSVASATGINLSSGDFTIESWVYWTGSNIEATICDKDGAFGSSYPSYNLSLNGSGYIRLIVGSGNGTSSIQILTSNTLLPINQWVHIAAVKNSTNLSIYQNGTSVASATQTATITDGGKALLIGYAAGQSSAINWNGYISNLRIVKGTAVYTAAFTVPTTPLTAITNTSLLTCQSNRFVDNSSNNFTITQNGDVSVQPFSPFAPTSAYSTSTNGGGMYSSGGSNYLTVASNSALAFGTGDYTIETWIYYNVKPTAFTAILNGQTTNSISFYFDGGTYASNALIISNRASNQLQYSWTPLIKTWYHLAVTRSGTSLKLFINGAQVSSTTNSTNYSATTTYTTFYDAGVNTGGMDGYISNLRALKGTALYTADFTPPTAPLTTITNTELLLNGTNAGIFDNTGKNVLETVGNAQIDTGTKKFGTGSLEFDGSGDFLSIPSSVNTQFGTGNFTIEFWFIRVGTNQQYARYFQTANGDVFTGISISQNNTTQNSIIISLSSNGSGWNLFNSSVGTLNDLAWNHCALVRNGSSFTFYINGVGNTFLNNSSSLFYSSTQSSVIGGQSGTSRSLNGCIDDFRITKGIARYTADFTPPTAAFPNQ